MPLQICSGVWSAVCKYMLSRWRFAACLPIAAANPFKSFLFSGPSIRRCKFAATIGRCASTFAEAFGRLLANLEGVLQHADARFSRVSRHTFDKKRTKYWRRPNFSRSINWTQIYHHEISWHCPFKQNCFVAGTWSDFLTICILKFYIFPFF